MCDGDSKLAPDKSRIRIKLGGLEIEFEGTEAYLEKNLPELVEMLATIEPPENYDEEDTEGELLEASGDKSKQKLDMSTSMIANKLNANSGGALILAACAHLHLVKGHDKYTRSNILAEMQTATSYYKATYSKNLSNYFKALVKSGDLNELGEKTYSLHETRVVKLVGELGGK